MYFSNKNSYLERDMVSEDENALSSGISSMAQSNSARRLTSAQKFPLRIVPIFYLVVALALSFKGYRRCRPGVKVGVNFW